MLRCEWLWILVTPRKHQHWRIIVSSLNQVFSVLLLTYERSQPQYIEVVSSHRTAHWEVPRGCKTLSQLCTWKTDQISERVWRPNRRGDSQCSVFPWKVQRVFSTGLNSSNPFFRSFRDGLSGITERHPDLNVDLESETHLVHPQLEISSDHGVDIVLDLLRSYPSRSITYIVLGPMTNLARIMMKDGEMVRQRIGRIVCMGGALDVPGNITPTAECKPSNLHISHAYAIYCVKSTTSQILLQ